MRVAFALVFSVCAFGCIYLGASSVNARSLTYVSDQIEWSAPATATTHVIQFKVDSALAASGHVIVTPKSGAFSLEPGFDYGDVDFAVSNGGPYVERVLAPVASGVNDGVSIAPDGKVTITLNSSSGIPAGGAARITLGRGAVVDGVGVHSPVNGSSPGSYSIDIETTTAGGARIDVATAMIAITRPVVVTVGATPQPPVRANGLPSGELAAGNPKIELSLETNRTATCRYETAPGVPYSAMTHTFSSTGRILFYTTVSGHTNGTSYSYYVRCVDDLGAENDDDYSISFSLAPTPISNTSIEVQGSSGHGGVGNFPDGSAVLFLAKMKLAGWASPQSTVTILKDGQIAATTQTGSDGTFQHTLEGLERGAYTFAAYATDAAGRKSGSFTTTATLEAGTQNAVSDILIPPTLELSKKDIAGGEGVRVFGTSIPGSAIELFVTHQPGKSQSDTETFRATTTQSFGSDNGAWSITIDPGKLSRATYNVQARAVRSERSASGMSRLVQFGVGETTGGDFASKADINGDSKINLVDFSIMLSAWGTDDPASDINGDGTINLADFSILLFNWTG